ncbi:ATP-binding protein [Rhodoplanes sp. Z2-YC6860]|uniref:ATP-binding protein n=1 Tax=Rhodoplanes sp. Z2-YC6860 TaxID=674703 RepID=UPI00078C87F4|nr:ATP-binding protein [Rhodoplanes sp. Z2-YC6860]AMN42669.1 multi-sensor hybrid histidine kinase [Rhodoplanes sp. Z2-YC6860]
MRAAVDTFVEHVFKRHPAAFWPGVVAGLGAFACLIADRSGTAAALLTAATILLSASGRIRVADSSGIDAVQRASEMEKALAHMSQGIVLVDEHNDIAVINKRATELLHLPEEFVTSRPSYPEVLEYQKQSGEYDNASKAVKDFVAAGAKVEKFGIYERATRDGKTLEIHSVPFIGPDGQPRGFVRSYLEVTERAEAKRNLEETLRRLEEERDRREIFFANISHEMRTPLNGIIGMIELLKDLELDDTHHEYFRSICASADHLQGLINDTLDMSKMRIEGGLALDRAPFDIERALNEVISNQGPRARSKGIALTAEIDPRVPRALIGDELRVKQIMFNLIGNAIKFTDAGQVVVQLSPAGQTDEEKAGIEFRVEDTGVGIAADDIAKLCTPFTQVDGSLSRRHEGSGLGLSISKGLVEQMGGKLSIESQINRGSTFSFAVSFPRDNSGKPAARQYARNVNARYSILVAEDNETNQTVAREILKRMGHEVDVVVDGLQAVQAAARKRYDLILMDLMMPHLNGFQAATKIRALPTGSANTPILALTASTLKGQMDRIRGAGMNGAAGKPFTRAQLRSAIERVMAGVETESSPEQPEDVTARGDENEPQCDRTILNAFMEEMGEEAGREMIETFMRTTQNKIAALAVIAKNASALEREAHSLKSSAGIFGFRALSAKAAEIEINARKIDGNDIAPTLDELRRTFEETRRSIAA